MTARALAIFFFALMAVSWLVLMGTALVAFLLALPWQAGQSLGFAGCIVFGLVATLCLAYDRSPE